MRVVNLSPGFDPFPKEIERLQFESFVFKGGEPHIKFLYETTQDFGLRQERILLSHRVHSFEDMGLLLVAVDALRRMGAREIDLLLPYFPGARQDRVMVPGEPLTVKVYAELINQLQLNSVSIFDPHSEVSPALLNNCKVIDNTEFIKSCLAQLDPKTVLVSPDAGALKKVYHLSKQLGGIPIIECGKKRDVSTGQLSGFVVHTETLEGMKCLIVDDICDGGRTFLGLAEKLKEKGADEISLAISHGIFSYGIEQLLAEFQEIFCSNSFVNNQTADRLITFEIRRSFIEL